MMKLLLCFISCVWVIAPALRAEEAEWVIGPDYKDAPETQPGAKVPKGKLHEFTMDSKDSRIYQGIAKNQKGVVPYQRKVVVYVPAGYKADREVPFIVAQDGLWYRKVLPTVLDQLIHQKRVPPMVAVMIQSGGGDSKGSQRGLEYDTLSDTYATFIETEVLPMIAGKYHIRFTSDPEGRATMGGSSGGAAAFTMAWFRPDLYRKVLTYSGTYVDQQFPKNTKTPRGAWEYHENLIKRSAKKPIRVWLQVSENDNGHDRNEGSFHNWVMANQRMAAELKAKGYDYRFVYAKSAGHIDPRVTRQTLPAALEWLWRGYRQK